MLNRMILVLLQYVVIGWVFLVPVTIGLAIEGACRLSDEERKAFLEEVNANSALISRSKKLAYILRFSIAWPGLLTEGGMEMHNRINEIVAERTHKEESP